MVLRCQKAFMLRHWSIPLVLNRHYMIGSWTRIKLLFCRIHLIITLFVIIFKSKSVFESSARASALALINMVPLLFGLHLSFLADLCGVPLESIHEARASVSFLLGLFHVIYGILISLKRYCRDRLTFMASLWTIKDIRAGIQASFFD